MKFWGFDKPVSLNMRRTLLLALLVLVYFPIGLAALTSTMEGLERRIRLLEEGDAAKDSKIAAQDSKIAAQDRKIDAQDSKIAAQDHKIDAQDHKIAALDAMSAALKSGFRDLEDENRALAGEVVTLRDEIRDLRELLPQQTRSSSGNATTFAQHQHHRRTTVSSAEVDGSGRVAIYALPGTDTLVVEGNMMVQGKVFAEGGEVNELPTPTPTVSLVPTLMPTPSPTREPTPSPTSWTYGK